MSSYITSEQAFDKLMRIEKELDPWLWEYKGFPLWLGLRTAVFGFIHQELKGNKSIGNPYKNRYKESISIFKNKISYLFRSPFFRLKQLKNKHIMFAYENDIRGQYKSKNINIFVDPIRFYSPQNIESIELMGVYPNIKNRLYPTSKALVPYILKGASYLLALLLNKTKLNYGILLFIEKKYKIKDSIYNIGLPVDEIFKLLTIEIIYLSVLIPYWQKLFKNLNPRSIVGIDWYSLQNMVMYFVANNLKIPTVDLQHGIITSKSFSYMFKTTNLKSVKMASPKYLVVYGEYFKKLLIHNSMLWKEHQIHPLGYPWLSFFLNNISIDSNKIRNKLGIKCNQKLIVITSQPDEIAQKKLIKDLKEVKLKSDWTIAVKVHPTESLSYKKNYKDIMGKQRIKFVTDKEISLYELLKISDIHVSFWSAVLWEAPAFGIKNFILETENSYLVEDVKRLGFAKSVKNLQEIFNNYSDFNYKDISFVFNNLDGSSPKKISEFLCNLS